MEISRFIFFKKNFLWKKILQVISFYSNFKGVLFFDNIIFIAN